MIDIEISGNQIPIFIYKNHRMSFYLLCKLKKELDIDHGFFVVTMDYHNDLAEPSIELKDTIKNLDYHDLQKIEKFAKTKLGKLNEDWIFSAMEAGLVNDILIISPQEPFSEKPPSERDYIDSNNVTHRLFYCKSPDDLGGINGKLTDRYARGRNRELKESIGYPGGDNSNIILDIDLDYFTYTHNARNYVMDINNIKDIFASDSQIWWIREKAKGITIAKEHSCCGGAKNSRRILRALRKYFLSIKFP